MSSPIDLALATFEARRLVNRDPRHWLHTLEAATQLARELPVLPPLNWVADLRTLVRQRQPELRQDQSDNQGTAGSLRLYEDLLFERVILQPDVQRLLQATRSYAESDRDLAATFAISRLTQNLDFCGTGISPSTLRRLRQQGDAPRRSLSTETAREATALICAFVEKLQQSSRLVTAQDLYEAESGLALVSHTQRLLAFSSHQLLTQLNRELKRQRPERSLQANQLSSRSTSADSSSWATGGYQSIGTRGRMESLLGSELAYAEEDAKQRPDLFDARLVRGEALFFQRDDSLLQPVPPELQIIWTPDVPALQGLSQGSDETAAVVQLLALTGALGQTGSDTAGSVRRQAARIVISDSIQRSMADEIQALRLLLREPLRRGTAVFDTQRCSRKKPAFEVEICTTSERDSESDSVTTRQEIPGVLIRLGQSRHQTLWFPAQGNRVEWSASVSDLAELTRAILTAAAVARM